MLHIFTLKGCIMRRRWHGHRRRSQPGIIGRPDQTISPQVVARTRLNMMLQMRPSIELSLTQPTLRHAGVSMDVGLKDGGGTRGVHGKMSMYKFTMDAHSILTDKHLRAERAANNRLHPRVRIEMLRLLLQEYFKSLCHDLEMSEGARGGGDIRRRG